MSLPIFYCLLRHDRFFKINNYYFGKQYMYVTEFIGFFSKLKNLFEFQFQITIDYPIIHLKLFSLYLKILNHICILLTAVLFLLLYTYHLENLDIPPFPRPNPICHQKLQHEWNLVRNESPEGIMPEIYFDFRLPVLNILHSPCANLSRIIYIVLPFQDSRIDNPICTLYKLI